jgi:DNA-binding NtrC family response regulator
MFPIEGKLLIAGSVSKWQYPQVHRPRVLYTETENGDGSGTRATLENYVAEKHLTILLLHSAPVVRSVLADVLESFGYLVRVAGDLGTAVDMLKECAPNLLITAPYIAEISGHDAAQYLCNRCPKMRVLIVAGLPQDQRTHNRTIGEGYEVFPEPFSPDALVEKVKEMLRIDRTSAQSL